MAWGEDGNGQLGIGTTKVAGPFGEAPWVFTPMAVNDLSNVTSVSAGYAHTLAVSEGGSVMAWGLNSDGQLGVASSAGPEVCEEAIWKKYEPCSTNPVVVPGLSGVRQVAAGGSHSLALLENGTVMAWGNNFYGQLGQGTTAGPEMCETPGYVDPVHSCSTSPIAVPGLTGVVAVAAGADTSFALLENGTVLGWGLNEFGDLGNGDAGVEPCGDGASRCNLTPTPASGLSHVTAIASGRAHSLALLSDGTVMAWGSNNTGEIGDGSQQDAYVPVPVMGLTDVTAVAAGSNDSVALLADGTVDDWGDNSYGQLGVGTSTGPERCSLAAPSLPCSTAPVSVSGLTDVTGISAGFEHDLALLGDGTVEAWGYNEYGSLGTGTYGPEFCREAAGQEGESCSRTPAAVEGLTGVSAIAVNAGADDSFAYGPLTPVVTGLSGGEAGAQALKAAVSERRSQAFAASESGGSQLGGTYVTIAGSDLSGATSVRFGATPAESFTVKSLRTIAAVSPPGTGTVDIVVTTPRGESAIGPADRFTYTAPTVTRVKPSTGDSAGGTAVTITGVGFTGATAVRFGTREAQSFTVDSATSIMAVTPVGTVGPAEVTVTAGGTSEPTARSGFGYKGLRITEVAPAAGPPAGGTQVSITGSGFALGAGTSFLFGKTPASAVDCSSSTSCLATSPPSVKRSTKPVVVAVSASVQKIKNTKLRTGESFTYQ